MSEVICFPTMPLEAETVSTTTSQTLSETTVSVPIATETQMGVGYVATDDEVVAGEIDTDIHPCGSAFVTPHQVKNTVDMLREETQTKIEGMVQIIKECWDNAFPSQLEGTGWQKLPNGLTLQWTHIELTDFVQVNWSNNSFPLYKSVGTWKFPLPFSQKPFLIGGTPGYDTEGGAIEGNIIVDTKRPDNTFAGFAMYSTQTNTTIPCYLFAVGVVEE